MEFAISKRANFAHWTKYVHINTSRLYLGFRFWGESISQKSGILSTEEGTFNTNAKCCIQFCQKRGLGLCPHFFEKFGGKFSYREIILKIHSFEGQGQFTCHAPIWQKTAPFIQHKNVLYHVSVIQFHNSSSDHENKSFFDILLRPFGISWEEKSLNPYSNI